MPYTFRGDIAIADVAYEATGKTIEELFIAAGLALTETQVKDLKTVEKKETRILDLKAKTLEQLLHDFLQELIFYKDADLLLLTTFDIKITQTDPGYALHGRVHGEQLDMKKHELLVDVKAVSWHMFEVKQEKGEWKAFVILDV
ncbi:MAG TPA: archease [Candidatus Bilamarchaeaceae archaeon]|nr:archease [Candidatus Bilamarchaeaceae archaeon]